MRRRLLRLGLPLLAGTAATVACGLLLFLVGCIFQRGASAISWTFLTEQIRLVGAAGGIFYNIVGTLILIGTALFVTTPLAIGAALTHSVLLPAGRMKRLLGSLLSLLNGVPSILFGLFGLIVFVQMLGWGKSWLTGGLLLAMMILPTVTIALIERISSLPFQYIEAAAGLGLNKAQIIWAVILPQSLSGLVTGSLLGLARAAGETAPIMFTATIFAGASLPSGIQDSPVLSLPYHIFVLSQDSFDPDVSAKVWGAALILLVLVLGLSLIALPMRLRIHEEARHG